MALLLKRVNILLALIIISLSLGLIKFKNHLYTKYTNDVVFSKPNIKPNIEIPVIEIFLN